MIQKSRYIIKPTTISSVDSTTIPAAYQKSKKADKRIGLIDELISEQENNKLPSNVLIRRDGGRAHNDGIKTDVRNELKGIMRKM